MLCGNQPEVMRIALERHAAALIICSRDYAEAHNLEWLALLGAPGQVAGPDNSLHGQPAHAISAALERGQWEVSDLDFIEINEAFAAVSLHSTRALGVDEAVSYVARRFSPSFADVVLGRR